MNGMKVFVCSESWGFYLQIVRRWTLALREEKWRVGGMRERGIDG